MLSSYMLEMTCLVFLMVSTDWSSYTLRLAAQWVEGDPLREAERPGDVRGGASL